MPDPSFRNMTPMEELPAVYDGEAADTQLEGPSPGHTVLRWLILIGIYAALNGLLWGAQELYYYRDTRRTRQLRSDLAAEETRLSDLEAQLLGQKKSLDSLGVQMDRSEAEGQVDQYNANVDAHNALVRSLKADAQTYQAEVKAYNAEVDQVNRLIKKSGSRWYLIPIPFHGKQVGRRATR